MRTIALLAVLALIVGVAHAQQEPRPFELDDAEENLALGCSYLFSAIPSYRLTDNETDLQDLTDGLITFRADDKIWFDANACAWQGDAHVNIQLDLGEVNPIAEIGIRLLGGAEQGGLKFPAEVVALVSDDGESWRQVGLFVKPAEGEADDQFGMPAEEGVAYTYPLRFRGLEAAGRYVGLAIAGDAAFIASDEMWVFEGEHDIAGAEASQAFAGDFIVHNFQAGGVTSFFPKARVFAGVNLQGYQTLHGLDNRPEESKNGAVDLIVDLPEGVTLSRWVLNQRFGGAVVEEFATEQIEDDGGSFTRYIVPTRGIWIKNWGTLYWRTDWEDGRVGTMRMGCRWEGGEHPPEEYVIEAVRVVPVTPPERLHISIAWMNHVFWQKWPDFIETYRDCGFNAVPIFPRYAPKPETDAFQDYLDAVQECRGAGLRIINNSSPLHDVKSKGKDSPEVYCQLADGPARWLCPSYRGELWDAEVEKVAQRYSWTAAEWLFYDCEVFSSWFLGGNVKAKDCTRCQEAFAEHGGEWDQFIADQGAEFYRAVHARIAELVADAEFEAGAYGVRADRFYHEIWDWPTLYPELHQAAMPSMYGFRPGPIGDSVREQRALMTASDIIPWLQPGDLGEMPAEYVRAMALEVLLNGGRGVTYYTNWGFDAADLRAVSQAVAIVGPIEDLIMDGQLLDLDEFACEREGVRLGGIRTGDQVALLVSEYDSPTGVECSVALPAGVTGEVYELTPDGQQPVEVTGGALTVTLDDTRARVFLMTLQ